MEKIKNYLGLARKGGYLVIGSDKLAGYEKKLFLVLIDKEAKNTSKKIASRFKEKGIDVFEVENLSGLTNIKNCKLVGLKNKGLSVQIINLIKEN